MRKSLSKSCHSGNAINNNYYAHVRHSIINLRVYRTPPSPSPSPIAAPHTVCASRFTRQPQSQSIVENDAVDLQCEATGPASDLQYNWLHNGEYDERSKRESEIAIICHSHCRSASCV